MSIKYYSESENNENTVEVLATALNQIAAIVNSTNVSESNWNKIKKIIDQANFDADF